MSIWMASAPTRMLKRSAGSAYMIYEMDNCCGYRYGRRYRYGDRRQEARDEPRRYMLHRWPAGGRETGAEAGTGGPAIQ